MPRVGFEPTIPVLERAKTVHALNRVRKSTNHLQAEIVVAALGHPNV
jgi:hypothetical protein